MYRSTVHAPTFVYTVDGTTYRYSSSQATSTYSVGQQVMGYYDPSNPAHITENKPRRPVLGGVGYFICAAVLLVLGAISIVEEFYML